MARRFAETAMEALQAAGAADRGGDAAVGSVIVRVGEGADGALVTVERTAGGSRVSCSCGRRPCPHLADALAVFATPPAVRPLGIPSHVPPPPSAPVPPAKAHVRPPDSEIATRLRNLLDALIVDGVAVGSERTDATLEDFVRLLHGVDTYGLHRSLADLRREMATARPSPDRLLRAIEGLEATCQLLERRARGEASAAGVYELLVGRDRPLGELEVREDLALLEVARNSARTPFGYRRDEQFLVDLSTGARYTELVSVPIDPDFDGGSNRYGGSVGPFPRLIRADRKSVV